jgi:hypothetical protein
VKLSDPGFEAARLTTTAAALDAYGLKPLPGFAKPIRARAAGLLSTE